MRENPDKLGMKLFNTRPEIQFEEQLKERGISYRKFVKIGLYLYDFIINETHIIEIDGPYHWNPNLYGSKHVPIEQKLEGLAKTQERDKRKTSSAIEKGYKLFRIKVENGLPQDWHDQLKIQGFELF
jgi:very-short-patch-repair endonuclease